MNNTQIYTFFSYKGGVGRSMATANIAIYLNWLGYKVLVMDCDLDAPGIEHYFLTGHDLEKAKEKEGVVELLESISKGNSLSGYKNDIIKISPRQFLKKQNTNIFDNKYNFIDESELSELHLLTAGNKKDSYSKKVNSLNLSDFYGNNQILSIDNLKSELREEYDFVLIDSRAGATFIGTVCNVLLGDRSIMLTSLMQAGFDSTKRMEKFFDNEKNEVKEYIYPLVLGDDKLYVEPKASLILPSRVDDKIQILLEKWIKLFNLEFEAVNKKVFGFSGTINIRSLELLMSRLRFDYVSDWAYGENLPALIKPNLAYHSLQNAYFTLTLLMVNDFKNPEILLNDLTTIEYRKLGSFRLPISIENEKNKTKPNVAKIRKYTQKNNPFLDLPNGLDPREAERSKILKTKEDLEKIFLDADLDSKKENKQKKQGRLEDVYESAAGENAISFKEVSEKAAAFSDYEIRRANYPLFRQMLSYDEIRDDMKCEWINKSILVKKLNGTSKRLFENYMQEEVISEFEEMVQIKAKFLMEFDFYNQWLQEEKDIMSLKAKVKSITEVIRTTKNNANLKESFFDQELNDISLDVYHKWLGTWNIEDFEPEHFEYVIDLLCYGYDTDKDNDLKKKWYRTINGESYPNLKYNKKEKLITPIICDYANIGNIELMEKALVNRKSKIPKGYLNKSTPRYITDDKYKTRGGGSTAIAFAASRGYIGFVKYMLSKQETKGLDVFQKNYSEISPLMRVVWGAHNDTSEYAENLPKVESKKKYYPELDSIATFTLLYNKYKELEDTKSKNVFEESDCEGWTAINGAIFYRNFNMVNHLLGFGANTDLNSPWVVEARASLEIGTNEGYTPLMCAVNQYFRVSKPDFEDLEVFKHYKSKYLNLIKDILSNDEDSKLRTQRNTNGYCALDYLVINNSSSEKDDKEELFKQLLSVTESDPGKSNLYFKDYSLNKNLPIFNAIDNKDWCMLSLILNQYSDDGESLNVLRKSGNTLLELTPLELLISKYNDTESLEEIKKITGFIDKIYNHKNKAIEHPLWFDLNKDNDMYSYRAYSSTRAIFDDNLWKIEEKDLKRSFGIASPFKSLEPVEGYSLSDEKEKVLVFDSIQTDGSYYRVKEINSARKYFLSFYEEDDDVYLYEIKCKKSDLTEETIEDKFNNELPGFFTFIRYGEDGLTWLNGTSPPIHQLNSLLSITLKSENLDNYLSFFCSYVHGELGGFRIIERNEDIHWGPRNKPDARTNNGKQLVSLIKAALQDAQSKTNFSEYDDEKNENSVGFARKVVFYGSSLFLADFEIHNTGMVEMKNDFPILTNLSAYDEVFEFGLKTKKMTNYKKGKFKTLIKLLDAEKYKLRNLYEFLNKGNKNINEDKAPNLQKV